MRSVFTFLTLYGLNFFLWGCIGLCRTVSTRLSRFFSGRRWGNYAGPPSEVFAESCRITTKDVAVLIPARNEEKSIHRCLDAITRLVAPENVFVGSDGSTDRTVEVVRDWGCNVSDIQPNGGKARTLDFLIREHDISGRFPVVLILDADSEVDQDYFNNALPLFDDPAVVAVAGHALPRWTRGWWPAMSSFYIGYRVRLYRLTQLFLRYGQTWKHSNVAFIVPGFASMYRSDCLDKIDITAPGMVIEDFNMTFELHHKHLGRVAYTPTARCVCQDPGNLRDYVKQVKRWYLGFWQTVRFHGVWPSLFWAALSLFILEMLIQSALFICLPALLVSFLLVPGDTVPMWLPSIGMVDIRFTDVLVGVFLVDYLLTVIVVVLDKKPSLLIYGIGFTALRWVDSCVFLLTLPMAFFVKSDGSWVSPART